MSVRAQIIENGLKWVQNRPFGLKLGPEACQDRSGAFGMGLTHSKGPSPAKKVKKCARAAPGLAGRYITLGSAAKGYVSDLTVAQPSPKPGSARPAQLVSWSVADFLRPPRRPLLKSAAVAASRVAQWSMDAVTLSVVWNVH